ncbi:hypothetical protein PENTCL1PPCAC_6862, partial [Pristionchus entomophagus]
SRSGSISRSKPLKAPSSSTHISFTPETLLFAASNYRQSKDVEVHNNGQSTIMFKMKSTSSEYYRIRPVFFVLRPKEKRSIQITFKGLPSDRAMIQKDRITAVMAFAMSTSNDVKMLWEKHRQIAHQPHSSSRQYIKIDFEDERRTALARGTTNSAPKTDISRLSNGCPYPPDGLPPPSLPRPSTKVANSGGRDASITHPNSTKKEQAIRPPSIHPSDLRPSSLPLPSLERLEPSLRTSNPLPPSQPQRRLRRIREAPPPLVQSKSKTLPVKIPPSHTLPPPPPINDSMDRTMSSVLLLSLQS